MEWWCWKFDQWKAKIMTSMIVLGVDQPWVWKGNIEGKQVMSVQGRAIFYCSLHYSFDFKKKLSPLLVYTKNKRSLLLCAMNVVFFFFFLFTQFKVPEPSKVEDYWMRSLQGCRRKKCGVCAKEIWREGGWFDIANMDRGLGGVLREILAVKVWTGKLRTVVYQKRV